MLVNKLNVKEEWKILNFEVFENRPKTDKPYPPEIVQRRELLLFAQCYLADYQVAKDKDDKEILGGAYRKTMGTYFAW